MHKKPIFLVIILLAFGICGCTKEEQKAAKNISDHVKEQKVAQDFMGWNKTHWGMTENEILEVFKDKIVRFDQTESYRDGKEFASIGMKDLEIINTKFNVSFVMDQDTKKLIRVTLQPADKTVIPIMFKILEMELMEKYGTPFYRDNTSADRKTELLAAWYFPSTIIQLGYFAEADLSFRSLSIQYMQNSKKDYDKL